MNGSMELNQKFLFIYNYSLINIMKRKQTELTVEVPLQGQNKSNFLFEIFFSN